MSIYIGVTAVLISVDRGGVLHISDGIDNMGSIQLDLLGCLALAWVFVFLCLIKGVQSSGRVSNFSFVPIDQFPQ